MRSAVFLRVWLVMVMAACGDATSAREVARQAPSDASTTTESTAPIDRCGSAPPERPIGWDERTSLGLSAAEAFADSFGTCRAPLRWDPGWSTLVAPSEATANVDPDRSSARIVGDTPELSGRGCRPTLRVDATSTVLSTDGFLNDSSRTTLTYRDGKVSATRFTVSLENRQGELPNVEPWDLELEELGFVFGAPFARCAGEVGLQGTWVISVNGVRGEPSWRPVAEWSHDGCGVGSQVPLTAPLSSGESPAALITRVWGQVSYRAQWNDGTVTTLIASVVPKGEIGCKSARPVFEIDVPVEVTYETVDLRLTRHTASGRASIYDEPHERLSMYARERVLCSDPTAPGNIYTHTPCTKLASADLHLSLHHDPTRAGRDPVFPDLQFRVDERHRGSAAAKADQVHLLQSE